METKYYIADVFAMEKYSGNQLAVFLNGKGITMMRCRKLPVKSTFQKQR